MGREGIELLQLPLGRFQLRLGFFQGDLGLLQSDIRQRRVVRQQLIASLDGLPLFNIDLRDLLGIGNVDRLYFIQVYRAIGFRLAAPVLVHREIRDGVNIDLLAAAVFYQKQDQHQQRNRGQGNDSRQQPPFFLQHRLIPPFRR